jgi:hypothetical protein
VIRRLLLLLIALFLGWRWLRRNRAPAAPRTAPADPARADASMVRDRICNTFLPRSRALVLENGSSKLFFCSATCRDKHLAAPR